MSLLLLCDRIGSQSLPYPMESLTGNSCGREFYQRQPENKREDKQRKEEER